MTRFLLLYSGPPLAVAPSHEGWPEWFEKVGDALVDRGSPMLNGVVLHADGSTSDATSPPLGYSIASSTAVPDRGS